MGLYAVNRYTQLFRSIPHLRVLFRNHFNDFLGAIAFIAYVNFLLFLCKRPPFTTLPALLVWAGVCSVAWEGIAPIFLPHSTGDWWDCLAYTLGMLTYWCLRRLLCPKTD